MDGTGPSSDDPLRRYSSFLLRRWELPAGRDRIVVSHLQSGREVTLTDLDEAARWIEGTETRGADRAVHGTESGSVGWREGRVMGSISRQDTPVAIAGDGVELRMQEIGGGMTVGFVRVPKGTDFAPALKGLPGDLCQCPHWGYLLAGRVRMRTKQGEEIYEPGRAFYWAPGHAPEALEDAEYVDFSPSKEFNEVIDHIKGQEA